MRLQARRPFYLAVFAISGFSGLIYESIWTHYLKLFLGHAAYAQTLVLVMFMGGLAVGSWLAARYSTRLANPLRAYAAAEAIVGVFALAFHLVFVWATDLTYATLIPALGSPAGVMAAKWSLASLLILPQSVLLGTTFPLMTIGVIRIFPERPGRTLAALYFTNSIGGAVGVLTSGFVLIKFLGLPGTIALAGILNLLVALTIVAVAPRTMIPVITAKETRSEASGRAWYYGLLAASFATGAASFVYEIAWIRMLSLVLGSSTHSFELMLSAFVFGLALGGLWVRRRIDVLDRPIRYLAFVQVAMGLCAISTLVIYGEMFRVMRWLLRTIPQTNFGYVLFNLSGHGIAMAVMLPATFLAGMTLPLITLVLLRTLRGETVVGTVYAANTLGAIAGILLAVHIGFPFLGLKGLIVVGGSLDILVGLCLLYSVQPQTTSVERWTTFTTSAAALAGCMLFVHLDPRQLASGVYRPLGALDSKSTVIRHEDGKTASVDLVEHETGTISIRTNGKTDASLGIVPGGWTSDEPTMVLTAAIPLSMRPNARSVANIGFGSGLTTHVLLSTSQLERVDTIEIEKAMVELAQGFYPRNELAYSDPRSRIHIDDAKSFFSTQRQAFDVIISEPSNPWVSGVAGLFSKEFYALVRRHLAHGGLFAQWLQLYEIDPPLVASVLKAVDATFDDYELYSLSGMDALIVASNGGPVPAIREHLFENAGISRELRRVGILGLGDLTIRRIATRRVLEPLIAMIPIDANSDYWPVLDQGAAKARFLNRDARAFRLIGWGSLPLLEMLDRAGPDTVVPGESKVTTVPYLLGSWLTDRSMYLRSRILGEPYPDLPPSVEYAPRKEADDLLSRCESASASERYQVIQQFAVAIGPFLRPSKVREIWDGLQTWRCVAELPPHEHNWLALARAVGDRNAEAMAHSGTTLLQAKSGSTESRRYALTAAMLGNLAIDRRDAAASLWNGYGLELYRDTPDIVARLLLAHALHRADSVIPRSSIDGFRTLAPQ